jgi:hypothetical protein
VFGRDLRVLDEWARAVGRRGDDVALAPSNDLLNHLQDLAGQGAYIRNEGDDNVVALVLKRQRVTDTIPIGDGPRKDGAATWRWPRLTCHSAE